jgi:hypothetical protein
MYTNTIIRNLVIIAVLFVITYCLAVAIDQGNALGIFLSLASMIALGVCISLATRLMETSEEEEVQ